MKKKRQKIQKGKRKKGLKKQGAAKNKPQGKAQSKKPTVPAAAPRLEFTAAMAPAAVEASDDNPLGACFYVDGDGRNRCKVTTEDECDGLSGTFRPNKRCPGGVG